MAERREAVKAFYSTPEWRSLRGKRLKIDGHTCMSCGSPEDLHVHHKHGSNADNFFSPDPQTELVTLCGYCHSRFESHDMKARRAAVKGVEFKGRPHTDAETNLGCLVFLAAVAVVAGFLYLVYTTKPPVRIYTPTSTSRVQPAKRTPSATTLHTTKTGEVIRWARPTAEPTWEPLLPTVTPTSR